MKRVYRIVSCKDSDEDGVNLESAQTNHISSSCYIDIYNSTVIIISIPVYPSHTQTVERYIDQYLI